MSRQTINPPSLFNSTSFGFSQVTLHEPGKLVYISGQVAWDTAMNIVGKDDLGLQTQKAFENLKTAIEAAGGGLENIVMLRLYIVNYQATKAAVVSDTLRTFFGTESPPSSTWISVIGLADKDFLIEVEAQAVL